MCVACRIRMCTVQWKDDRKVVAIKEGISSGEKREYLNSCYYTILKLHQITVFFF